MNKSNENDIYLFYYLLFILSLNKVLYYMTTQVKQF